MTRASYSSISTASMVRSTGIGSPQSSWFQPQISPVLSEITSTLAPASSSRCFGTVNSDCSKPSVARIATLLLLISAMTFLLTVNAWPINAARKGMFRAPSERPRRPERGDEQKRTEQEDDQCPADRACAPNRIGPNGTRSTELQRQFTRAERERRQHGHGKGGAERHGECRRDSRP